MNNLRNKKYLQFKKDNHEFISNYLREYIINSLIMNSYISVSNDDSEQEYIFEISGYEFLTPCDILGKSKIELGDNRILAEKAKDYVKLSNDVYTTEGTIYNNEYDEIDITLDELIYKIIIGVLDTSKCVTLPTNKSLCISYSLFLEKFFSSQPVDIYEEY